MNLSPEEFRIFIQEAVKTFGKDTEWIISRGWYNTFDFYEEDGFKLYLWEHPDGAKAIHCTSLVGVFSYPQAVNVEEQKLLEELGWGHIYLKHFEPDYLNRKEGEDTALEYEFVDTGLYYLHPVSKKVYSYPEAVDIARYKNNDDQNITDDMLCGKTLDIRKGLGDTILSPNTILTLHFKYDNDTDKHKWVVTEINNEEEPN